MLITNRKKLQNYIAENTLKNCKQLYKNIMYMLKLNKYKIYYRKYK